MHIARLVIISTSELIAFIPAAISTFTLCAGVQTCTCYKGWQACSRTQASVCTAWQAMYNQAQLWPCNSSSYNSCCVSNRPIAVFLLLASESSLPHQVPEDRLLGRGPGSVPQLQIFLHDFPPHTVNLAPSTCGQTSNYVLS